MFKFRTMYAGEETRVPVDGRAARVDDIPAKTPTDPRVTRLGRVLRPKPGENRATFYSLVTADTVEQDYAERRQLFLTEQGYPYRIEHAP